MEKVLIIAYFYPPCTLTAAARPAAWAEYLHRFGYHAVVITRNWDIPINQPSDISRATGNGEIAEHSENKTVYYLPYRPSLKDRIYARYGNQRFSLLRKVLSFLELIFQNFFFSIVPFNNFYYKAEELLRKDPSIKKLLITANPFVAFFIGYRLKKKFPELKWVADYRDDWNTTELLRNRSTLEKIIVFFETISEKKWVPTASYITSISGHYVNKISAFTGVKGKVLLNGFSDHDLDKIHPAEKNDEFIITHNGKLYITQPFQIFLEGYKKLADKYASQIKMKLYFPGLAFVDTDEQRIRAMMKGYEHLLHITTRIPRKEVFDIQNRSHALLMVAHEGAKGVSSSKLYEYLCFKKPVILCPPDGDIMQDTLEDTGTGIICNNSEEVFVKLSAMIESLLKNGKISVPVNEARLMTYTRSHQVAELAGLLNSL